MPCRCDYMEPDAREAESKLVGRLLVYVLTAKALIVPHDVMAAANNQYGYPAELDAHTAQLCELCQKMTPAEQEAIIYNAHHACGRELATWWDHHKQADAKRDAA